MVFRQRNCSRNSKFVLHESEPLIRFFDCLLNIVSVGHICNCIGCAIAIHFLHHLLEVAFRPCDQQDIDGKWDEHRERKSAVQSVRDRAKSTFDTITRRPVSTLVEFRSTAGCAPRAGNASRNGRSKRPCGPAP